MTVMGNSPWRYDIAEANNFRWRSLEQDLVDWWMNQSERSGNLITTDGEHLIVVNAGQRNDGAGPDILNSHLILGDMELSGSVEMHCKAVDWYTHKHDQDPNYENVILHVVEVSGRGPDLPTLLLPNSRVSRQICIARRVVRQSELLQLALFRFQKKADHVRLLAENEAGFSPLLLGMVEMLLSGSQRHWKLQELALKLGLSAWPDAKVWRGSNQAYPSRQAISPLLEKLFAKADLFNESQWQSPLTQKQMNFNTFLNPLLDLGISRNQSREWVVNILAPYHANTEGFKLWIDMAVFRHYGIEKTVISNLGLNELTCIATQQAVLEWQERYCSTNSCFTCPLTRSH